MNFKRGKKSITLLILIELLLSALILPSIVNANDIVIVDIENISIPPGGIMNSTITIHNIENFGSCDLTVMYDPAFLEVVNVTDGNMSEFYCYIDNTHGILNITAYSRQSLTGDIIQICKVSFKAKNTTSNGDVSVVTFGKSQLLSAEPFPYEIDHVVANGTVTIETNPNQTVVGIEDLTLIDDENGTTHLTISDIVNLGSLMVSLSFDSDLVNVVDVVNGDMDGLDFYVDNVGGWVNVSGYVMDPVSADLFHVASIVFQATSSADVGDVGLLLIHDSELLSADPMPIEISHSRKHGTITIGNLSYQTILSIHDVTVSKQQDNISALTISSVENLGSLMVSLSFDSDLVNVVDVVNGDMDGLDFYVDNVGGWVNVSGYVMDPVSADLFHVASIVFQATSSADVGDVSLLLIPDSQLLTADPIPTPITHTRDHGMIYITAEGQQNDTTMVVVEDVSIYENTSGQASLMITHVTDLGSALIQLTWDPMIAEITNLSGSEFDAIDYYVDNTQGILNIIVYTLGSITSESVKVADLTIHARNDATPGNGTEITINNSILLTASPIPDFIVHERDHGYLTILASSLPTVMIDDVNITENATGETRIMITDIANLGSCELDIRWDPDIAHLINVTDGDFDSLTWYVNNTNGRLMINAYSLSPINDDEFIVAVIRFEAATSAPASTTLQIANSTLLTASPTPVEIDHHRVHGVLSVVSTMNLSVDAGGPYTGKTNKNVQIQCSASGGTPPYQFSWDLNDDGIFDDATGETITYQWSTTGVKTISVQVRDHASPPRVANDSATVTISSSSSGTGGKSSGGVVSNKVPTAVARIDPLQATVNEVVTYDGQESTDDGTIQSYSWDYGDGTNGVGMSTTHRYTDVGIYLVSLTVTDDEGATDTSDPITVTITQANNPPTQPVVTGPTTGKKNIPLSFNVTATDPDEADSLTITIDWGDSTPDTILTNITSGETITVSHSWSGYGLYTMIVTSTDASNAISNARVLTIAIDVHQIDDIIKGLLIDENSDGIYDVYRDDETQNQTEVSNHNGSWYLIDVDDDGQWDYDYDVLTQTLNTYHATKTNEEDNTGLCLLIVLIILIFIVLAYIVFKKDRERKERIELEKQEEKERKQKEEEEKKKAEEQKKKEEEVKKAKRKEEQKASDKKKTKKKKPTKKTTTKKK